MVLGYMCYLIQSRHGLNNYTYIGITNNLARRINQHSNHHGGAKYTRRSSTWVAHTVIENFANKSEALKFEYRWKHKTQSGIRNKMRRLISLLMMPEWQHLKIKIDL